MPPRDYIIDPTEYDLGNVLADIHEIRRWNKQRFEMEQLTAIVHEDAVRALCVGYKDVTRDEFWVRGHFPSMPVMPGVLIIECMAQTAAVLVVETLGPDSAGKLVYFMTIDNAKFRKPVVPGDQMRVHVKKERQRGNIWKFSAEAKVDGKVVAEATYAAMILDR